MCSGVPVIKKGFILNVGPIASYLYNVKDTMLKNVLLNNDAVNIFTKCDGLNSIDMISQDLSSEYGENFEDIKNIVSSFILNTNYFEILDEPEFRKVELTGFEDLQVPLHLLVELTDYCNYYCKHCFNDSSSNKNTFIDADKLLSFLNEISEMGVHTIDLSGGEPLNHPKFNEIVEFASKMFKKVTIISNGTLINKKHIDIFKKYKDKITLRLTLNSSTPDHMDDFCGKVGAFNKVMKIIPLLVKEGVNVEAAMNVTPFNQDDIEDTLKLSMDLGCSKLELGIISPMGRAMDNNELVFSDEEFFNFENEVNRIIEVYKDYISKSEEYNAMSEINSGEFSLGNCGAGVKSISISPLGNAKLCPIDVNPYFTMGNVLNENLKDVLLRIGEFRFDKINKPQPMDCGSCDHLKFCQHCIVKGCIQYKEIGNQCFWGEKYLKNQITH
ncbi:MAG: radical SAM protein [Methanobrevibacter sp.]|nr:radical SAM protein [Candidatus Methanovirga procula]